MATESSESKDLVRGELMTTNSCIELISSRTPKERERIVSYLKIWVDNENKVDKKMGF